MSHTNLDLNDFIQVTTLLSISLFMLLKNPTKMFDSLLSRTYSSRHYEQGNMVFGYDKEF